MTDAKPGSQRDRWLSRRTILAGISVGTTVALAGCTQRLPFVGDEAVEFSADPTGVPQEVLDATGYEKHERSEVVIEESFQAAGQSQEVIVTNWQSEYDKSVDLGGLGLPTEDRARAAIFSALSTPQVSVVGRTFNPVADMSAVELAEMVQDRYDGISDLDQVDEASTTVADESTTVGEFEGRADLVGEGATLDITLHIAEAVEVDDDLVVGIGGYPTDLQHEERENIFSLLESVEYEG